MATRTASPARDEARHWLPSQGVDPAPLAELNAECLGLLAMRAAAAQGDGRGEGHGDDHGADHGADDSDNNVLLPPLLAALRGQWAALSAQAVRRLAAAPFTLFDAGFGSAPRWLELRSRGVSDQQHRCEPAYFELAAARSITRRMLVYGWHLARSRPRAACLVFGATTAAVESLAACSLATLEAAAERNADALRPRWSQQHAFWRELLASSSAGADKRLHELLLGGIQRLAAETLAAHAP